MTYPSMTVKVLRALLVERGCEAPPKANKSELVGILQALDSSEPAVEVVPEPVVDVGPKTVWTTVDDRVTDWVDRVCERHALDEADVIRGMLYCAYGKLSRRGDARAVVALKGAIADVRFRRQWL